MNEFRDAIANAIVDAIDGGCDCDRPSQTADKAAEAVLDMPEMHALRAFLAMEFRYDNPDPSRSRAQMINHSIPANVADWVLS